jgi:hypothetical protein
MGNAVAVEDPPPARLATEACLACVELAEQAMLRTLERCHGVADSEVVATLRWHLPQQSLATSGCEAQAACFEALGVSQLIQRPPEGDAEYAAAFLRVARRFGRLHAAADELEGRLARHASAWWWRC